MSLEEYDMIISEKQKAIIEYPENQEILDLYIQGFSAQEIKEKLNLSMNIRTIQRWAKIMGIIRTHGESLKLRIARGNVNYNKHPNPNKIKRKGLPLGLRAKILERDGYKCLWCGATAKDSRLQVDHIDNDPSHNDDESNFQTLCEECNKGKYRLFLKAKENNSDS